MQSYQKTKVSHETFFFPQDKFFISWYKCFSHPWIANSTPSQKLFHPMVVQKFPWETYPILFYSTGRITNSTPSPPSSTGLLGRPLSPQLLRAYFVIMFVNHVCYYTTLRGVNCKGVKILLFPNVLWNITYCSILLLDTRSCPSASFHSMTF